MVLGLILEVTGYIGRLELHFNPFKKSGFLVYLVPLTMGPAFLSAAVYREFLFFLVRAGQVMMAVSMISRG